jgi:hypothetical protein
MPAAQVALPLLGALVELRLGHGEWRSARKGVGLGLMLMHESLCLINRGSFMAFGQGSGGTSQRALLAQELVVQLHGLHSAACCTPLCLLRTHILRSTGG